MIVAQSLSKTFGNFTAVDSLDFKIEQGEVVGFLGPNGAGKTTTIRMICGYLPPSSGTVRVDQIDVMKHPLGVRSRIGYLPETAPLYAEMRVIEYLRFRGKLFGLRRRDRNRAVSKIIERCWLETVHRKPIRILSKGYRQRVGLAAALLHEPPVLILDEPTAGLDPNQIREVRSLIRELSGSQTILLSTHILPEAEVTCDRILMIARGKIRADGAIDELRQSAARHSRYIIETDVAAVSPRLATLPGVIDIDTASIDDRWTRILVTTGPDAPDLRELIGLALADMKATTRELRREAPTLEHLFIQVMADAETGNPQPPRPPRLVRGNAA
jgi:ABC-2 type transport system ATP-binding protein